VALALLCSAPVARSQLIASAKQPHFANDTRLPATHVGAHERRSLRPPTADCRANRTHTQLSNDFARADELRDELATAHGVRVHDGTQRWCAGVPAGAPHQWATRRYGRAAADCANVLPRGISAAEIEARRRRVVPSFFRRSFRARTSGRRRVRARAAGVKLTVCELLV
jgi:hypothetical protein